LRPSYSSVAVQRGRIIVEEFLIAFASARSCV
jgi:hypothetical protein